MCTKNNLEKVCTKRLKTVFSRRHDYLLVCLFSCVSAALRQGWPRGGAWGRTLTLLLGTLFVIDFPDSDDSAYQTSPCMWPVTPVILLLGIYPEGIIRDVRNDLWTRISTVDLFTIAISWNRPKCSTMENCFSRLVCFPREGLCSQLKWCLNSQR